MGEIWENLGNQGNWEEILEIGRKFWKLGENFGNYEYVFEEEIGKNWGNGEHWGNILGKLGQIMDIGVNQGNWRKLGVFELESERI